LKELKCALVIILTPLWLASYGGMQGHIFFLSSQSGHTHLRKIIKKIPKERHGPKSGAMG